MLSLPASCRIRAAQSLPNREYLRVAARLVRFATRNYSRKDFFAA
jgi:hypothetical protein